MRYLCRPVKKYYAPLVTPEACENEEAARTWADLRAPGRGPWAVVPFSTEEYTRAVVDRDASIQMNLEVAKAFGVPAHEVITNDDPDYFKQLRIIEEEGP